MIEQYIESKKNSWAATTIHTEYSRLRSHAAILDKTPDEIFDRLHTGGMKRYSIKTTMTRISDYYQWLIDNNFKPKGPNPFKVYFKTHSNNFKQCYQPKRLTTTFGEAQEQIDAMPDGQEKLASRQLLEAGLRSCELSTLENNRVTGKGGKTREVFLSDVLKSFKYKGKYYQLFYALKKVGLTPHDLRKLCATEFSRLPGVITIDILESFGWTSADTALKYQQPMVAEKRGELFKQVVGK